jgi:hypothetical protein
MSSRRFVSLAVATVLLAAALPAAAQTAPPDTALRASIDRALTAPAPQAPSQAKASSRAPRHSQSAGANTGGGGGGGRMILALLGTALSVGATIYVVKQMQKTKTEPTPSFR